MRKHNKEEYYFSRVRYTGETAEQAKVRVENRRKRLQLKVKVV